MSNLPFADRYRNVVLPDETTFTINAALKRPEAEDWDDLLIDTYWRLKELGDRIGFQSHMPQFKFQVVLEYLRRTAEQQEPRELGWDDWNFQHRDLVAFEDKRSGEVLVGRLEQIKERSVVLEMEDGQNRTVYKSRILGPPEPQEAT